MPDSPTPPNGRSSWPHAADTAGFPPGTGCLPAAASRAASGDRSRRSSHRGSPVCCPGRSARAVADRRGARSGRRGGFRRFQTRPALSPIAPLLGMVRAGVRQGGPACCGAAFEQRCRHAAGRQPEQLRQAFAYQVAVVRKHHPQQEGLQGRSQGAPSARRTGGARHSAVDSSTRCLGFSLQLAGPHDDKHPRTPARSQW